MTQTQDWFSDIEEIPAENIQTREALQIAKIATGSPAATLGLSVGDFLLSVNGQAALTLDLVETLLRGGDVTYSFYLRKKRKQLKIRTRALPLGLRLEATSEGLVTQYERGRRLSDFSGLMTLWERKEYASLRHLAQPTARGGLISKLMSKVRSDPMADLINAVCDIEDGNEAKGYAALEKFSENEVNFYTSDVHSLVHFYTALKLKREGSVGGFKLTMADAMNASQTSDRMVRMADSNEVYYVKKGQRLGQKHHSDIEMPCLEGEEKRCRLSDKVESLDAASVQPICFLPSYRGNGPYNDAMKLYHVMYPHVKDRMAPLFVITNISEKRPDRPHWFEAEQALISASIPITVAFDPNNFFVDDYLTGSPEFIAVNKESVVIWDGPFDDDYDYWEMLSCVNAA